MGIAGLAIPPCDGAGVGLAGPRAFFRRPGFWRDNAVMPALCGHPARSAVELVRVVSERAEILLRTPAQGGGDSDG